MQKTAFHGLACGLVAALLFALSVPKNIKKLPATKARTQAAVSQLVAPSWIVWTNPPFPYPELLTSGVLATTNLTDWTEVVVLPYSNGVNIWQMDTSQQMLFYRIKNSVY